MKKMVHCGKALCGVLFLGALVAPGRAHADNLAVTTSLGFEFASGDYGTGTRTQSVYAPLTVSVAPTQRLGFSLEIPFVYQSNSAVNTGVLLGSRGMMSGMQKGVAAMNGPQGSGGTMSSGSSGNSGGAASGLGDITAKAGYVLVPEGELMPRVRPYLFVKFPTGDENKALGTGAFNEGGAVELSKQLGYWYTFAEAGYTFQGHSSVLSLKDYFTFDAGAGYAVTDRLLPMLVVKTSTSPIEGASGQLETRLKLKYLATPKISIDGYVGKGWTRSSADYVSGISVSYDY